MLELSDSCIGKQNVDQLSLISTLILERVWNIPIRNVNRSKVVSPFCQNGLMIDVLFYPTLKYYGEWRGGCAVFLIHP